MTEPGSPAPQTSGRETPAPSSTGGDATAQGAAPVPAATAAQIQEIMAAFWQQQITDIEHGPLDFKFHQLPLARIKKVMKADEDVKMISAEAPLIFSKACEIFILELTMRAWIHTEENKRRTLQKSDVATAVSKADMYDFLIDIVPRDEINKPAIPPGLKDLPAAYAYYQNAGQYLAGLTPEQQTALAFQIANPQTLRLLQQQQGEEGGGQGGQEPQGQSQNGTAEQQFYLQQLQQQLQQAQNQAQAQGLSESQGQGREDHDHGQGEAHQHVQGGQEQGGLSGDGQK
ncbi:hypothetical protein HK104_009535 [Borealophlyctis nickersoniae]|nr:hypothetical protein HK104_009535 [Borealophlyctis nickersoniae]